MAFEQTMRWFGPDDPVNLMELRETGVTGIVSALHQVPVGEIWSTDEILKRKRLIETAGMTWSVVESLPVHEDIKKRTRTFRTRIENYKASIRNLGTCGIDTVCYNFMPVHDWARTDLSVVYRDGSITTKFETKAFAAFELFLLEREGAEESYTEEQIRLAKDYFERIPDTEKKRLTDTVLFGLPGSLEKFTLEELRSALHEYDGIGDRGLHANLREFIREIAPVAEESGVFLAIHPDDPPWPLLGLPRVVSTQQDASGLLAAYDSPHNGLTFCTGSYGASIKNDLIAMAQSFAPKINFLHLRNLSRNAAGDFIEENTFEGDIDMYSIMKILLIEQQQRKREGRKAQRMPMRPDHGHLLLPDRKKKNIYPGYSLAGRMKNLAELRGMELAIRRSLELD